MLWGFYKISHVKYLTGNPAHSIRVDPDLKKSTLCWNPSEKNNPERRFLDLPGKQTPDTFWGNFRLKNRPLWNVWNWKSTTPEKVVTEFPGLPRKTSLQTYNAPKSHDKVMGLPSQGPSQGEKWNTTRLLKISVPTLRKDKLKLLLAPSPPEPPSSRLLPKPWPQSPRRLTSLLEEHPPPPYFSANHSVENNPANSHPGMKAVAVLRSAKDTY